MGSSIIRGSGSLDTNFFYLFILIRILLEIFLIPVLKLYWNTFLKIVFNSQLLKCFNYFNFLNQKNTEVRSDPQYWLRHFGFCDLHLLTGHGVNIILYLSYSTPVKECKENAYCFHTGIHHRILYGIRHFSLWHLPIYPIYGTGNIYILQICGNDFLRTTHYFVVAEFF